MHLTNFHFYITKNHLFSKPVKGLRGCGAGYGFAFNGKELDPEGMGGGGSTYDYGFRIYNAQLGKFLSVDPLTKDYPFLTPYQFASNTPIVAIDLDGLEAAVVNLGFKVALPVYGLLGVTGGAQIALILDHQFNLALVATVSAGVSFGEAISVGGGITFYPAVDTYQDLLGFGGSLGVMHDGWDLGAEANISSGDYNYGGGGASAGKTWGTAVYADVSTTNLIKDFGKLYAGNWQTKIKELSETLGLSEDLVREEVKKIVKTMNDNLKKEKPKDTKSKANEPKNSKSSKDTNKKNAKDDKSSEKSKSKKNNNSQKKAASGKSAKSAGG